MGALQGWGEPGGRGWGWLGISADVSCPPEWPRLHQPLLLSLPRREALLLPPLQPRLRRPLQPPGPPPDPLGCQEVPVQDMFQNLLPNVPAPQAPRVGLLRGAALTLRLLPPLRALPAARSGLPPLQKGGPRLLVTATESAPELRCPAGPWGPFPGPLDALPDSEGRERFLPGGGLPQGPLLAAAAPSIHGAGLSAQLLGAHRTQGAPACPPGTPRPPLQEVLLTLQVATPRRPAGVPPDSRSASGPQDAHRPGQLFQPPVCHDGTCFMGNLTTCPKGL